MYTTSIVPSQTKSIFAENSIIEFKYKNKHWIKGVILSYSRSNGIIIDLIISNEQHKQIKLHHSIAMTYYHINKTLKPLNILIPHQLFTIGTKLEYKYKDKEWRNGEIININPYKLNETKIKIKKTMNKYKIIKISRSKLIIDYAFNKTLKLSNKIYPYWISLDTKFIINNNTNIHYKIARFRDGKSMTFKFYENQSYRLLNKCDVDIINIKHSEIRRITQNKSIETDKYIIKSLNNNYKYNENNIQSINYNWKINQINDIINNRKDLLCNGYIKINSYKYIPTVIIELISYYISNILDDIKNAEYKQAFYTPVVSIKSFKWSLEIYPNGLSDGNRGFFEIYLCLKSIPSNIFWVGTAWKLKLKETNTTFTNNYVKDRFGDFDRSRSQNKLRLKSKCRMNQVLSLNTIKDLDELTFEFHILYNNVMDKNTNYMKFEQYYYRNSINHMCVS